MRTNLMIYQRAAIPTPLSISKCSIGVGSGQHTYAESRTLYAGGILVGNAGTQWMAQWGNLTLSESPETDEILTFVENIAELVNQHVRIYPEDVGSRQLLDLLLAKLTHYCPPVPEFTGLQMLVTNEGML
ncbi:hypothetical protein HDU67_004414, partial [Dinochytrium kinnereticum]